MTDGRADATVAIVGGGPVGMALALALHQSGVRPAVFDARPRGAAAGDPRVLALAHGSRLTLEALGLWPGLAATPIKAIHISQRGGFGRTRLSAADYGIPALGYVVGAGDLSNRLAQAIDANGIEYRGLCRAVSAEMSTDGVALRFQDGVAAAARMVVWAEGAIDDRDAEVRDYGQQATICSAEAGEAHCGTAYERFTESGPLAALPHGKGWSIVFTTGPDETRALATLGDSAFIACIEERFGRRMRFTSVGPRTTYALALRRRRNSIGTRQVWVGNAAQTLHPVAGQGFNLALRDIWELTRRVASACDAGADPGAPDVLEAYQRSRRLDRSAAIGFTDGLVRLFGSALPPLRTARGLGLLALDLMPPLRDFVAKRMMFGARAWP
jgi:2-octaprenyl-6-methoxyphenol hydroxylase